MQECSQLSSCCPLSWLLPEGSRNPPCITQQPQGSLGLGGGGTTPTPIFGPTDTEYISTEELAKVDKMLSHLSEESKQAAATMLVSLPCPCPCPHKAVVTLLGCSHSTAAVQL